MESKGNDGHSVVGCWWDGGVRDAGRDPVVPCTTHISPAAFGQLRSGQSLADLQGPRMWIGSALVGRRERSEW